MTCTKAFGECTEQYTFLDTARNALTDFFEAHPSAYKLVMIFNHLFRAAAMVGFMKIPGLPLPASLSISIVGSLLYTLTVEKKCAYKFTLAALGGAIAFMMAMPSIINMINGVAFTSVGVGILSCISLVPLALYFVYVGVTVSYDIDKAVEKKGSTPVLIPQASPLNPSGKCGCKSSVQ